MNEDSCLECWWYFGTPQCCRHPAECGKREPDDVTPCGWFEAKAQPKQEDPYEEYERIQNEFN